MKVIDLKKDINFLHEYCELCSKEWGSPKTKEEMEKYVDEKTKKISFYVHFDIF